MHTKSLSNPETILENLPQAVFVLENEGKIIFANKRAGLFGLCSPSSDHFDSSADLFNAQGQKVTFSYLKQNFSGLSSQNFFHKTESGSVEVYSLDMARLDLHDNTEEEYLVTARNITASTKISQTMLNISRLDAIGLLAGNIAHDFNNILSGLFGYLQLAREAIKDSPSIVHLDEAGKVYQKARTLTQQLMTFSKGIQLNRKPGNIGTLIQDTVSLLSVGNTANISFDFPDSLWSSLIDEAQLAIVFDNIILNAVQAGGIGIKIRISAENVERGIDHYPFLADKRYLLVKIADNGKGIPEKNINHVFDPFFSTQKRKNGLGLSTAFSIVKSHEGFLTVESTIGSGCTFFLYLPALDSAIAGTDENSKPGAGMFNTRVLIMDDEDFIRDVARQMLQRMGFKVTCSSNSETTVNLYESSLKSSHPYDLVILDLTIPEGEGGLETFQKLLKINPEVRAIASSGYAEDPAMIDPKSFGFKSSLTKPYTKDDLSQCINLALLNN